MFAGLISHHRNWTIHEISCLKGLDFVETESISSEDRRDLK